MATGQIGIDCVTVTASTGINVCPYNPKNIGGVIFVPAGTVITPTQVTAMQATLTAAIANNSAALRWLPVGKFEGVEDLGTDAVTTETEYGDEKYVRNGKYRWKFMYSNGALDLHSELSKMNGKQDQYDVILIDHTNNALILTASGAANYKGFSMGMLFAPNIKINTGSADTVYSLNIGLDDSTQLNENWRLITMPKTIPIIDTFQGLRPIRLEVVTEIVGSTKTVVIRVWSGSQNLYDYYPTELATAAAWNIRRDATGISTVASAVTAVPATKSFQVVSSTMATTTASDECTVLLGPVSALTSAGVLRHANAQIGTTAT